MIIGAPWRIQTVGPYSLKIGRQVTGTGTAYQQVSAELIIQLNKIGVVISILHCRYPRISREVITVGRSEIDREAVKIAFVISYMVVSDFCEWTC